MDPCAGLYFGARIHSSSILAYPLRCVAPSATSFIQLSTTFISIPIALYISDFLWIRSDAAFTYTEMTKAGTQVNQNSSSVSPLRINTELNLGGNLQFSGYKCQIRVQCHINETALTSFIFAQIISSLLDKFSIPWMKKNMVI